MAISSPELVSDRAGLRRELGRLEPREGAELLARAPADLAVDVLRSFEAGHQYELLAESEPDLRRDMLHRLPVDERARLIGRTEAAEAWLADLEPGASEATARLLRYPEESVGRIMTPHLLVLDPDADREAALEQVRQCEPEVDSVYRLPVSEGGRLLGMVELRELLSAPDRTRVRTLVHPVDRLLSPHEDQEVAARLVLETEVLAAPVVEDDGTLVGLVTVDDAMEILQLEEAEDVAMTSGVQPLGAPYLATSLLRLVRTRAVWLVMAAAAGVLTVQVLDYFESELEQVVALALFIPLLLGTGGNIGAQAATTVVRAMAVDDLRLGDLPRVVWREASVGVMLGGLLAVLAAAPIALVYEPRLAFVVCLTLLSVCVIGTSAGSVLPLAVGRMGGDPAVVSAPFITTLVDATGLLVYFGYARLVFGL